MKRTNTKRTSTLTSSDEDDRRIDFRIDGLQPIARHIDPQSRPMPSLVRSKSFILGPSFQVRYVIPGSVHMWFHPTEEDLLEQMRDGFTPRHWRGDNRLWQEF